MTFEQQRSAALAILTKAERLTRRAGSFAGQCAVDPTPLSEAQMTWFLQLAERAGVDLEGLTDGQ